MQPPLTIRFEQRGAVAWITLNRPDAMNALSETMCAELRDATERCERDPAIRVIGAQPQEGSRIPGIRKWPEAYMPKIYEASAVDELVLVSQSDAEEMCQRLAREEGIFGGISAAGACQVALELSRTVENATIAFVVCDRGDRYLSTGVFPA